MEIEKVSADHVNGNHIYIITGCKGEKMKTDPKLFLLTVTLVLLLPVLCGANQEGNDRGDRELSERVKKLEEVMGQQGVLGKWSDRITLSGTIEVEAGYEKVDFDDPAMDDEDSSDIVLATAELGVDVDLVKHVTGHVLFLYEEDENDDNIAVDEAIIRLDGEGVMPLYLELGKRYVPFGNFESHFVSDPLTLEIGETQETGVMAGFANEWFELSVGAFNGDIDEIDEDNHINNFVAAGVFTLPENSVSGLGLTAGVSWINNIADSDTLQDEDGVDGNDMDSYVSGFSAFVSVSLKDSLFMEAEYLGALEDFEAGELAFDGGEAVEPKAWNIELAYAVTDALELGLRYEGSEDCGDLLPETQYGAVASYGLFENTTLAVEYLRGEFENDDERDLLTAQLAFEF